MLSQRQKKLLMLLLGADGWRTGPQLARELGVSGRLVKTEVSRIRDLFGNRIVIRSNTRLGYRLVYLADDARAEALSSYASHSDHHRLTERYVLLYLSLLLEDRPVSMSVLAERLYCSKATVAEQVKLLRYRTALLAHAALAISGTDGVRIAISEVERRYELSKWDIVRHAEALFPNEVDRAFLLSAYEKARNAVAAAVSKRWDASLLSGSALNRIARFVAVSALRAENGHELEGAFAPLSGCEGFELPDNLRETAAACLSALELPVRAGGNGAVRHPGDMLSLAHLLLEHLDIPLPGDRVDRLASAFLDRISQVAVRPVNALPPEVAARFSRKLGRVLCRLEYGHSELNYRASEISLHYPLAAFLAAEFLARHEPAHASKAETMYLALAAQDVMTELRPCVTAVLVSDEPTTVTDHVSETLRRCFSRQFGCVEVHPVEGWRRGDEGEYLFTTDLVFSSEHPSFQIVPAIPGKADVALLVQAMDHRVQARRAEFMAHSVERSQEVAPEALRLLGGDAAPDGRGEERPFIITSYRSLVLLRETPSEPSRLRIACPSHAVLFRGKAYDRVIEVRWNRSDIDAYDLSAILSDEIGSPIPPTSQ